MLICDLATKSYRVIKSCKTDEQLEVANRYFDLVLNSLNSDKEFAIFKVAFTAILNICLLDDRKKNGEDTK